MTRHLLNLLTALSLLLCVVMCVLWVRSYASDDAVERYVAQSYSQADWSIEDTFYSYRGAMLWVHDRHPDRYGPPQSEDVQWRWFHPLPAEQDPEPQRNDLNLLRATDVRSLVGISTDLSFDRDALRHQWRERGFHIAVPHKWPALVLALLAAPAAVRLVGRVRKSARSRQRRCPSCGYDLRATQGRCPECGTTSGAP
jgi:hypothetical protein